MKRKFKLLLLLSNIGLIVIGLNIFLKFIPFESSKVNPILILILCLVNIIIALKASFEAAENK